MVAGLVNIFFSLLFMYDRNRVWLFGSPALNFLIFSINNCVVLSKQIASSCISPSIDILTCAYFGSLKNSLTASNFPSSITNSMS
ncbi:hypothetical protein BD408DRAFT_459706 [Parasitella parasitica]|nr:hypothetical protein BD408DRAFT_459706 [Parasitella parasitica]